MNKREYERLHREERDAFKNTLKVGDFVIFTGYGREVRIGRICYFTSPGKCKIEEKWPISDSWRYYPYTRNLVKLDNNMLDFIESTLVNLRNEDEPKDTNSNS